MRLPNKYGSVVHLSGVRRRPWWARKTTGYKDNGQPIYLTIGYFRTKSEGLAALAKFNSAPCLDQSYNLTFASMFEKWKVEKFKKVGDEAVKQYNTAFKQLKELHNVKMRELKHTDVQEIINKDFAKKAGAAANIKKLVHQLYKCAMAIDVCGKNYAAYIELPTGKTKIERRVFTNEEIQWLFDNADIYRAAKPILIMIFTSMRINELRTLDVNNIYLDKRYMIGGIKTDAGKDRVIPISRKIEAYIREYTEIGSLLPTKEGRTMSYSNFHDNLFMPLMEIMGTKHTIHDCRHTGISLMREAGIESLYIKLIAGHATNDVTEKVYTHVLPERLVEEIDKI